MKILLTNDDGIDATGLHILEKIARTLSDNVTVVAPMRDKSGQSRAVTLSEPLRLRKHSVGRYSVSGTPVDCVVMGALEVMPQKPDLLISGINRGQNLAEDIHYSGTIGAAIMGQQLGIPSIALSQSRGFRGKDTNLWENTEGLGISLINGLVKNANTDYVLNVNLPDCMAGDVKGVQQTRLGTRDQNMLKVEKHTDPRNYDYYWIGYGGSLSTPPEGTDLWAIYNNFISITAVEPHKPIDSIGAIGVSIK